MFWCAWLLRRNPTLLLCLPSTYISHSQAALSPPPDPCFGSINSNHRGSPFSVHTYVHVSCGAPRRKLIASTLSGTTSDWKHWRWPKMKIEATVTPAGWLGDTANRSPGQSLRCKEPYRTRAQPCYIYTTYVYISVLLGRSPSLSWILSLPLKGVR